MEPSATGRGARPRGLGRAVTVRSLLGTRDFLTVLDPTPLNQRGQPIFDPVCEHLDMRCGFLPKRRQRIFHMRWHHGIATPDHQAIPFELLQRLREHALTHAVHFAAQHPEAKCACLDRKSTHTSELQSLMRISYAVFCLKKKTTNKNQSTQKKLNNST